MRFLFSYSFQPTQLKEKGIQSNVAAFNPNGKVTSLILANDVTVYTRQPTHSCMSAGSPSVCPHCVIIVILAAWCQITGLSLNERVEWGDGQIIR